MTQQIPTLIDHKLRVKASDLPDGALQALCEALSIPNLVKAKAKKMDEWGWENMPDLIELFEIEGDTLVMPRGFLERYVNGLAPFGGQVKLIEGRHWHKIFRIGTEIDLRAWQGPQVETLKAWEQGMLKAPAGSGKTVSLLALIQILACKSIVIVNTKDIIWQWQERAAKFLGDDYPVGQIGDGVFDVSPYLTIATAQTLNSRYEELEADGFFDAFSFMALDECHHATAETFNKIVNRFSSRYRFGVSATPDKTGDFELAINVLGPVVHVTRPDEVDTLMRPKVVRVPTKFGFGFRGHKSRFQRSNYGEMIKSLIINPERNQLIVDCIMEERGHHQLLVTKRLEHIQILEDLLLDAGFDELLVRLTGRTSNEDRDEAVHKIATNPGLMLSTLADEALDIPRLDRIHLPFPQKNTGLVTQQVGRVERDEEEKEDAIIFDYVDGNIGVLHSQWKARRFEVYEPRGYKIETRRVEA